MCLLASCACVGEDTKAATLGSFSIAVMWGIQSPPALLCHCRVLVAVEAFQSHNALGASSPIASEETTLPTG